ncbi:MAG: hypothetical protein HRU26_16385 [Psychroserpens sp.]|nr:hypothetical protein [Psychroserpens sp.]
MKKSFLFISCEEAHHICDKSQYGEATFWERVKLTIRLSWCKVTRAYTKRNRALTNAMKSSNVDCLKDNELDALKSQFNQELKNQ